MTTHVSASPVPDVVFPLRTRREDATGAVGSAGAAQRRGDTPTSADQALGARLPFLAGRLLGAEGPFGLEVEVKSGDRVVGTWAIDVKAQVDDEHRAANTEAPAQAHASLYVCASIHGDVRETGAFLVLRQWSVADADKAQVESLYEALSIAALERLDSLLGSVPVPDAGDESRLCILFLVDGRPDRETFSLDRLQIRLLEDLEGEHAVVGVDLRVAHGRGTGVRPHVAFASTLPPSVPGAFSGPGTGADGAAVTPRSGSMLLGEVFVRETLSPENIRWNRRASDRLR